ncbi:guanylate kinase [Herbiconiux sp. VKM Ac-1786]|jgi:guanylate kinase|uniref:guanylate kinase n=1 Tax=Herbiconiux sp. VKM Ac-1786 TaxID=2783824 RepID=UPI00188CCEB2|nr:guanylate kinase [Herbiconiux sp. VKM Ac-1786]MBF4573621.1 guanylate kinase [Herbiconiux sp. VKM Ac-1786]
MNPPDVDRVAASRAAVAARRARASVKRAVTERRLSAVAVLETALGSTESIEAGMRVRDLLMAIPGLGPVRIERVMESLGIATSKRLSGLGVHQQQRLREYLERRAPKVAATGDSRLVVLAGPTAVGKGTVSTYIRENFPEVHLSVSATTRAPRPGEVEGVSYYFVSDEEFDRMIEAGEFLEWAVVHNKSRYGTPRTPIDRALAAGTSVLLEIDIQGARQVKAAEPSATLVFLLPPTWDELVRRLIGRGTETLEEQERRLTTAKVELAAQDEFDFRVVNRDVQAAAAEVVELMQIQKATDLPSKE